MLDIGSPSKTQPSMEEPRGSRSMDTLIGSSTSSIPNTPNSKKRSSSEDPFLERPSKMRCSPNPPPVTSSTPPLPSIDNVQLFSPQAESREPITPRGRRLMEEIEAARNSVSPSKSPSKPRTPSFIRPIDSPSTFTGLDEEAASAKPIDHDFALLPAHRTKSLPVPLDEVTPKRPRYIQPQPFASTSKLPSMDRPGDDDLSGDDHIPFTSRRSLYPIPSGTQSVPATPVKASNPKFNLAKPKALPVDSQPSPLSELFSTIHLEEFVIAHDKALQAHLERCQTPWGITHTIYRGIQDGKWAAVDVIKKLGDRGALLALKKDADIGLVSHVIRGTKPRTAPDTSIGAELDREQAAILENVGRGLGLMGQWQGKQGWYGGQIQQPLRIVKDNRGNLHLRIEALEMNKSTRLGRFLGSRRVMPIRGVEALLKEKKPTNGKEVTRDDMISFLRQKFIFAGRTFVCIPPKDTSFYLIEINENHDRLSQLWCGDQHRISYSRFIDWHNPFALNREQPLAKFFARFHLLLSTSIPVLEFDVEDIVFIEDQVVEDWIGPGKAPAEKTPTDGCGYMNRAAFRLIQRRMGYESIPTAVQGRIGGAKGLWIIYDDESKTPQIWIRASQSKIKQISTDRSLRIFDLIDASRIHQASKHYLSGQSILNLAHGGVSINTFKDYAKIQLRNGVYTLLDWSGDHGHLRTWNELDRSGGVGQSRLSRLATAGRSRPLGFSGRQRKEEKEEAMDSDDVLAPGRTPHSFAPKSITEGACEMLQAGFLLTESPQLKSKVEHAVKNDLENAVGKFRIPLPDGTTIEAFVIPDPLDILEADQIFYKPTNPMYNAETGQYDYHVEGPVLIGRHPIRLASDIQRVVAVKNDELNGWPDVVIVSTKGGEWQGMGKGLTTLMSVLSGGDVDGDTVFVTWEPNLLRQFRPTALVPQPPNLQAENFEETVMTLAQFEAMIQTKSSFEAQVAFMNLMLSGFTDGLVGIYSTYHDAAVFHYGLNSKEAIRLAYMGNLILDSSKTGLRVKNDILQADKRRWDGKRPPCMGGKYEGKALRRLGPFVLEVLHGATIAVRDELLAEMEALFKTFSDLENLDRDLTAPLHRLEEKIQMPGLSTLLKEMYSAELKAIKDHVDKARQSFMVATGKSQAENKKGVDYFIDTVRQYHAPIESPIILLEEVLEKIKASYAYSGSKMSQFAFNVAFRDVLQIKADAAPGGSVPCTRDFDEARTIAAGHRKLIASVEVPMDVD
ncbi:RNA dependent RNA polymerase-domain-containing protein [Mycena floridula]|nr:RNA dependent RNA polymerase-domain-containing protein [Mycena floridula]